MYNLGVLCRVHGLSNRDRCYFLVHHQAPDRLTLPRCRAPPEPIPLLLLYTLIGHLDVAEHLCVPGSDDTRVDIGARAEIVEDTRRDGVLDELQRIVARHVGPPASFEDGHGGETTRAHGHVGEFVCGTVRSNGEEVRACGVDTAEDERSTNLALVSKNHA